MNGKGRLAGAEQDRERQKGRQARTGRSAGAGVKSKSVGGGCVGVLGVLRGGMSQLGSGPITSITSVTGDWSSR